MGQSLPPIPDDYDHVCDCPACYDPGKTPNYVFIRFWDIQPCLAYPAFPWGRTFICSQYVGDCCAFYGELWIDGVLWYAIWDMDSFGGGWAGATLQCGNFGLGAGAYFYEKKAKCSLDFSNSITTCLAGWGGEGGHGHVQIVVPSIIIGLTSEYHFVTQPNPLFETQKVGMDHLLVHLAAKYDKTNVLIYIDEEDLALD